MRSTRLRPSRSRWLPGSSSSLLAGNDGGVYLTTNLNTGSPTFTQLNDSMSTIEFYGGDITANFANSSAPGINAGAQDNGSPVNVWLAISPGATVVPNANQWQLRKGGDGMFARIEPMFGLRSCVQQQRPLW